MKYLIEITFWTSAGTALLYLTGTYPWLGVATIVAVTAIIMRVMYGPHSTEV